MRSEIIEAEPRHVREIFRRLRRGHRSALLDSGISRRMALVEFMKVFQDSGFRKAWVIDGNLAAVGGVTGSLLSPIGFVWLALTEDVIRFPLAIIRESRRQLGEIMATKTELATTILTNDPVAQRFSAFLGFHSKHDGTLVTWRDHLREMRANAPRMPVERGFVMAIGYHKDAA